MMSFLALLTRDLRLAVRAGGSAFLALAFFAAVVTLVPFGIGADSALLARTAAGILWVAAVLASLLAFDRLLQLDMEDGSLDLLALSPIPLEAIAAAKGLAHWLTTGLPLVLLSPVLAVLLNLPSRGFLALITSLAIGTPALSAIGTIGAALTISVRRGGLILPLIVLPLVAPAVIFGAGFVGSTIDGIQNGAIWLLSAFSLAAVLLSPFAAASAIRIALSG